MCSCEEGDPCDVYVVEQRKARKEYRCCDCAGLIGAGQRYTYFRSLFDGYWSTDRRCSACMTRAEAFTIAEGCNAPFGGLEEAIRECAEEDPDFIREWLHARREVRRRERARGAA